MRAKAALAMAHMYDAGAVHGGHGGHGLAGPGPSPVREVDRRLDSANPCGGSSMAGTYGHGSMGMVAWAW